MSDERTFSWHQRLQGWGLPVAGVSLTYAGHYLYGGLVASTSLALTAAVAVVLLASLAAPHLRRDLGRIRSLEAPAALFGVVLFFALLSLTPYAPGGPAPVWDYLHLKDGAASINKPATTIEIVRLLGLACMFAIGAITGTSDDRGRRAFNLFALVGGAFALWAFFTHVTGMRLSTEPRLEARFMVANTAGGFFAVLAVCCIGAAIGAFRAAPTKDRIYSVLPFAVSAFVALVCLIMSGSRGGSIAFGVGILTFGLLQVFLGKLKLTRALAIGGAMTSVVVAALLVSGDLLLNRFAEGAANSDARYRQAVAHFEAFQAAPWMGYGLGSFDAINRSIMTPGNVADLWAIRALHNVYLQWLEEARPLCGTCCVAMAPRRAQCDPGCQRDLGPDTICSRWLFC